MILKELYEKLKIKYNQFDNADESDIEAIALEIKALEMRIGREYKEVVGNV